MSDPAQPLTSKSAEPKVEPAKPSETKPQPPAGATLDERIPQDAVLFTSEQLSQWFSSNPYELSRLHDKQPVVVVGEIVSIGSSDFRPLIISLKGFAEDLPVPPRLSVKYTLILPTEEATLAKTLKVGQTIAYTGYLRARGYVRQLTIEATVDTPRGEHRRAILLTPPAKGLLPEAVFPPRPDEAMPISIPQVLAEAKADATAARTKYVGKLLRATGTVHLIEAKHDKDRPKIELRTKDGDEVIECHFPVTMTDEIASLKLMQTLTIEGIGEQTPDVPVALFDSRIVKKGE